MKIRVSFIALSAALALAACGGSDKGTSTSTPAPAANAGKQLFTSNCSTCHTLADAGAKGAVGPNLDQLRPGPDLVTHQVTNGGGGMPAFANKLTAAQIKQVADYVSSVAGK